MPHRYLLLLVAALALLVAACADDAAEEAEEPVEDEAEETDDEAAEDEDEAAADLMVADSPLGEHLVSADGLTLYLFTEDEPGVSNCVDECVAAWPVLSPAGEDAVAGDGVDEGLLGTIEREDGATQVTYDDWPLYFFAEDGAAGDVEGQGVNDVWWVVDPAGEPIEALPEDDEDDDEDDGGY